MNKTITMRQFWWLLALIFLIGLWLRLDGIGFGLPHEYHVDESQHVRKAARMGKEGLEPLRWNNPPFYKYILLTVDGIFYLTGRGMGLWISTTEFGESMDRNPTLLYLLGRGTSAIFGGLTVVLVGLAGLRGWSRIVGLLAAWFTSIAFILVRESHYATNDMMTTFFTTLTLFAALHIQANGERRWYVVAGAALGLGFATKYTAVFATLPVLVAHFLAPGVILKHPSNWQMWRLWLVASVGACTTVLASPYFIITPDKVIQDVYQYLYLPGRDGFEGWIIDPGGGYLFYLKSLLWGLGYGLLALSIVGVAVALWRRQRQMLVVVILPVGMYLSMGHQEMFFARFLLPAVPPLLLLAAVVLVELINSHVPQSSRWSVWVLCLLAVVMAVPSLAASLRYNALLHREDTRTMAKNWMESNLPTGSRIAIEWTAYSPQFSSGQPFIVTSLEFKGIYAYELDWFRQEAFDYVVATSFVYNVPWRDSDKDQQAQARYAELESEFELVYEVSPFVGKNEPPWVYDEIYGSATYLWEREYPGPTLKIFKVDK
jgi:4-amino-4-deoxy-L-arabinose transferase-like glycosyltransferase